MSRGRVVVVGIHGHGRSHLDAALAAHRDGRLRLVGVADPRPPEPGLVPEDVVHRTDLAALLDDVTADIVVISTPIHTHGDLARLALDAQCDVLLEKPPTATLAEFDDLVARAQAGGRRVQVGFQTLGSAALPAVRELIESRAIGEVLRYGASGGWVRDRAYWQRARWAGKRTMDGRVVADGVLTNPLAHATSAALAVAGATRVADVPAVDLDLHRANPIDADDTSVARLHLASGAVLTTAVTLCAAAREEPYVEVVGTDGLLRFYYAIDVVQVQRGKDDPPLTTRHARVGLMDNLLAARRTDAPLVAPLAESGGFMRLLDAVVAAPAPAPIDPRWVRAVSDERGDHLVVAGIESALHAALREERTFRELGLPWAR